MGSMTLTELAKGRLQFRASRKYGGYFRRQQEHRDFVSIGTAAGARTFLESGHMVKAVFTPCLEKRILVLAVGSC